MWIEIEDSRGKKSSINCMMVKRGRKHYDVVTQAERMRMHGRRKRTEKVMLMDVVTDATGREYRAGYSKEKDMWILSPM